MKFLKFISLTGSVLIVLFAFSVVHSQECNANQGDTTQASGEANIEEQEEENEETHVQETEGVEQQVPENQETRQAVQVEETQRVEVEIVENTLWTGKYYQDDENNYKVPLPEGWTTVKTKAGQLILKSPDELCNVVVQINVGAKNPKIDLLYKIFDYNVRLEDFKCSDIYTFRTRYFDGAIMDIEFKDAGVIKKGVVAETVVNRYGFLFFAIYGQGWTGNVDLLRKIFANVVPINDVEVIPLENWSKEESRKVIAFSIKNTPAYINLSKLADEYSDAIKSVELALGSEFNETLKVYFYPSKEMLYAVTRVKDGLALRYDAEIHELYVSEKNKPDAGYRVSQILFYKFWGFPYEHLAGEGLAIHFGNPDKDIHREAAKKRQFGLIPHLSQFLGDGWFNFEPVVAKDAAGSFMKFLIDRYGLEVVKKLYGSKNFEKDIVDLCGKSFDDVDMEWRKFLVTKE